MEYRIQVTEKLQHIETISAASGTEAVELVRQSYKEEKIVLSSEHFSDVAFAVEHQKVQAYYKSPNHDFILAHGDCFELLRAFDFKFDMIFADPPYFLSNGGISWQSGKVVCVDKGSWDKGKSQADMMSFNKEWLRLCRDKLKDNGTIWISGTYHNIFSVANCLTELGYKILNVITWQKTNPPANISCRFFTYSTEFVIWARKMQKVPHKFNYELMKRLNDGKQMTDVWRMPAIGRWEKTCGKHPTQKPLRLLVRMILASTDEGDWILDPFSGSATTGIAANLCGRGARRSVLPNGQGAERGDRRPRLLPLAGEPYRRSAKDRRARYGKGSPRRLSPYALLISAISGPAIVSLQTKTSPFGGQRGI